MVFFSEKCTCEAVCFFTVEETLPGRRFFLSEEGSTIGLVELLAFLVVSVTAGFITGQVRDAKLIMFTESWQKDGFYTIKNEVIKNQFKKL